MPDSGEIPWWEREVPRLQVEIKKLNLALGRATYEPTSRQAQMIQLLHRAHQNGKRDLSIDNILEELGTQNSRRQDTWRGDRKARESLIKRGARKGTLHLNL